MKNFHARYIFYVNIFIFSTIQLFLNADAQPTIKKNVQEPAVEQEFRTVIRDLESLSKWVRTEDEIAFAQIGNFDGSFRLYGETILHAFATCFSAINAKGGVNGKKLKLISLNGEGNPRKSEELIRLLKSQYGVSMFVGNMGTRELENVLPMIQSGEISVFFPWGGSKILRDAGLKHMITDLHAYHQPQITFLVDHITHHLRYRHVAIFHADDSFSLNIKHDLEKALQAAGREVSVARYNRLTMDLHERIAKLIDVDPKVVVCIGTRVPTIRMINNFFARGHTQVHFLGLDDATCFVPLILADQGISFEFVSPVPDPKTSVISLAQKYLLDLQKFFPADMPNALSFSYYLNAHLLVDSMQKIRGQITPISIIEYIEGLKDYDLGGINVTFDPDVRVVRSTSLALIKG